MSQGTQVRFREYEGMQAVIGLSAFYPRPELAEALADLTRVGAGFTKSDIWAQ